jgi:hypothetical protein
MHVMVVMLLLLLLLLLQLRSELSATPVFDGQRRRDADGRVGRPLKARLGQHRVVTVARDAVAASPDVNPDGL